MKISMNFKFQKVITLSIASISFLMMGSAFAEPAQRLIIKYKNNLTLSQSPEIKNSIKGSTIAQSIQQSHGISLKHIRKMSLQDRHVMQLGKRKSKDQLNVLISRLRQDPNILSVEEDALMQPNFIPNDQFYNLQWHYHEAIGGINAQTAWDTHDGTNVVVAVLDTGYTNHSDLVPNLLPGYDFIGDTFVSADGDGRDNDPSDPGDWHAALECGPTDQGANSSWHGTHTSGTVAAVTNNTQGVAGVAFGAKVIPVRVLGKCGGFLSDIADGIIWASGGSVSGAPTNNNPAKVINMSLGGSGACGSTYQSAIDIARSNGTVVVVSAGNSNADSVNFRPASCNGVINVAANDRQGNRASYSNFGAIVDVTAPGGETSPTASNGVASTLNSGIQTPSTENYVYFQGTSMAAPHVTGTVALMFEANPAMTPDEAETILKNTARALPGSCSGGCGAGIIDARAALDAIGGGPVNSPPSSSFTFAATDLQVNFTDTSSDSDGSIVGWSWNFGDGNVSSAQNPSHTYAVAATYSVSLTVTDNDGATDSSNQDVTVSSGGGPTSGGFTVTDIRLASKAWEFHTIDVPTGAERLEVALSGGSGNANLYVRFGSNPTTRRFDCRDTGGGNNEHCTITNPQAGTWHIGVKAAKVGASGVQLDAFWFDDF